VNNSGITALPKLDLSREEKKTKEAIEEFEQALEDQPPR
jgi:hypothetical protein